MKNLVFRKVVNYCNWLAEGYEYNEDIFAVSCTWWPEFKFVLFTLKPAE